MSKKPGPLCPRCQQPSEGICAYCADFMSELEATGGQPVTFRRAMEIADKHGLLTDSMRREWLEETR